MSLVYFVLALITLNAASGSIHCSIHGDTHVLMSDGASKFQHHSGGLFRVFATQLNSKRMEVQCEFTDRTTDVLASMTTATIPDPELSSCRLAVIDVGMGCGIDIRHGGLQRRGTGSVGGQTMQLSQMGQVQIDQSLGVTIVPLTNNALSIEVNWNGTFTQVVMAERNIQIHSTSISSCTGLCGSCNGPQTPPMDAVSITTFIASQNVPSQQAIQPQLLCGTQVASSPSSNVLNNAIGAPQLFMQSSLARYPYPAYSAPAITDVYYQAQFESNTVMQQVFAQCTSSDSLRLQYDPIFNSFAEDCVYDKSLGPGFEASAKSSMDAFVTFTESIMRSVRVQQALMQSMTTPICASCIPVQWASPISTQAILLPTVTTSSRLNNRALANFPLRYASMNNYSPLSFISSLLGSNSPWNSAINLPAFTSPMPNLLPLPQQLMTSPIFNGVDQVSFNPMPVLGGGICSNLDTSRAAQIEQMIASSASSGQLQQLASLIQQGGYPSVCQALACGMSSLAPSLTQLSSLISPTQVAQICPVTSLPQTSSFMSQYGQLQQSNIYGQRTAGLLNNYMQGLSLMNYLPGLFIQNGQLGSNVFGRNFNGLQNGMFGAQGINNGFQGINNGFQGINNGFQGINNGLQGINPLQNSFNGLMSNTNGLVGQQMIAGQQPTAQQILLQQAGGLTQTPQQLQNQIIV